MKPYLTGLSIGLFCCLIAAMCCGCGTQRIEQAPPHFDVRLTVFYCTDCNNLGVGDSVEAFDRAAARYAVLFPGESIGLESIHAEKLDPAVLDLESEARFDWVKDALDKNRFDDVASLGVLPGVRCDISSDVVCSGGYSVVGWNTARVLAIWVGQRLSRNHTGEDPIQRAADLILHELQHLRGLRHGEIRGGV